MRKPRECLICLKAGASYRFKCCNLSFCSTDCFQKHTDCVSEPSRTQEPTSRRFVRQDNFDLNLSEEEILSDELLGLVSQNIGIVDMLSESRLQRLLFILDNSRDRRQSFARLLEKSHLFVSLVERISEVISGSQAPV
jgi:hypothetical protein